MSVKIILSRTSEPSERRELVFDEETISLGREPSSIFPLQGSQVSKQHARIERQGSEYYIVDLNSTNSTYVNGERLLPGQQHRLSLGDRINISDYELEVFPANTFTPPPAGPGPSATIVSKSATPGNPAEAAPEADFKNDPGEVTTRWSTLTSDIQRAFEKFDIAGLARSLEELQARYNDLAEENRRIKAELENLRSRGEQPSPAFPEYHPADDMRLEQLTRVLLQLFFKLSSGRSSFLSEFIVRTTVRTTGGLAVQPQPEDERLRYFADSNLSEKEFSQRLASLKKEADELVLHMIGLLEGYRRSVDEGTRRILQRVDPDRLEEELPDTFLLRYIPPLADLKVFHLIRSRLRDLLQEDRGVLEKQIFRPGFARAYEECVESTSTRV